MTYAKPEITRIAEATAKIRDEGSLLKVCDRYGSGRPAQNNSAGVSSR